MRLPVGFSSHPLSSLQRAVQLMKKLLLHAALIPRTDWREKAGKLQAARCAAVPAPVNALAMRERKSNDLQSVVRPIEATDTL